MKSPAATVLAVATILLAACDSPDTSPAAPTPDDESSWDDALTTALTCGVDVAAGEIACGLPDGSDVNSPAGTSALIVGGQNTFVTLASSGECYEDACAGGSPGADIFQAEVTVENLIPQALATTDGESGDADGVRVFFDTEPAAVDGAGEITVANSDGTGTFTGEDQSYFQYGGTAGSELGGDDVLSEGETSDARVWQWNVPETVQSFEFTVYVSAAVQHPEGWVEVSGPADRVDEGGTEQLDATVYDVVGREVDGRTIAWDTDDADIATVDASGLVTGGDPGVVEITASSDGPETSGTASVNVDLFLVDVDATGADDGMTWADAYPDLNTALTEAGSGGRILVAEGTYRPTSGTDRGVSFTVVEGMEIYGGFAGGETSLAERDWAANPTVLSGDIGTAGDATDNSYHVVYVDGVSTAVTSTTVIDGFTITAGYADEDAATNADGYGGGLDCVGAGAGAGCSPRLQNLFIVGNHADFGGGGLSLNGSNGRSSPTLVNVTFVGNDANTSTGIGGAIKNTAGAVTLSNSILWGNDALAEGEETYNVAAGQAVSITISTSTIQGGVNGDRVGGSANANNGGNLDADPTFVNAAGADGVVGTLDDDLRLQAGSPAIDAGNESFLPLDVFDMDGDGDFTERLPLDLDANPRVAGTDVDMGAYERP